MADADDRDGLVISRFGLMSISLTLPVLFAEIMVSLPPAASNTKQNRSTLLGLTKP